MKEIDFERAAMLLDVIAKVTNVGPMNQPILGEAQQELKAIVADCESNRAERADKIRAEEQVAAQKKLDAAVDTGPKVDPQPPKTPIFPNPMPIVTDKPVVDEPVERRI